MIDILSIVGEDPKKPTDLTFAELHDRVIRSAGNTHDRCLRRHLKGLRISKNDRGYYEMSDAVLVVGWIKRRSKYNGYTEFLTREGKTLYKKAIEHFSVAVAA